MDQRALLDRFKAFYANLGTTEWAELDEIYREDVRFTDPVHKIEGRSALHHYIAGLCRNLHSCRFDYLDEVVSEGAAYIKWDMYFSHPKLRDGPIAVRGVTQLAFDERGVFYHEDFYDMGAVLYENLPIFGGGVRWLKRRLSKASA